MDMKRLNPDTRAALGMCASVFLLSWYPLVVALVGTTLGPFVFHFWINLIGSAVWLAYTAYICPSLIRRNEIWTTVLRLLPTRDGILAILCGFSTALFVWATYFLDTALVTVINGGWLILSLRIRIGMIFRAVIGVW